MQCLSLGLDGNAPAAPAAVGISGEWRAILAVPPPDGNRVCKNYSARNARRDASAMPFRRCKPDEFPGRHLPRRNRLRPRTPCPIGLGAYGTVCPARKDGRWRAARRVRGEVFGLFLAGVPAKTSNFPWRRTDTRFAGSGSATFGLDGWRGMGEKNGIGRRHVAAGPRTDVT
jgi:hypothetical protein